VPQTNERPQQQREPESKQQRADRAKRTQTSW
jgi:hypothetical protein